MKSAENLLPNLARALGFVWQSGRALTIANVFLVVVQGVLPLVALYLIKLVVDSIAAGLAEPDKTAAFKQVLLLIALSGVVALFEIICTSVASLISAAHAQIVTDRMFSVLHSKSIEVDLEYYENSQYYDTLHRAQSEAPYRPPRILNGLLHVGQSSISLVAIAGLLLTFHWSVLIFLVAAALPGLAVRLRYAKKMYSWEREKTPAERQSAYFNWVLTKDSHAKELRLFNLGRLFAERFSNLRTRLRQEKLDLMTKRTVAELTTLAGATVAAFGLYGFLAYRAIQGLITIGDLVMFFQAVHRGQGYLRQVLNGVASLYEDNLFLSNMYEFFSLKPKLIEARKTKPVPRPLKKGIVFDHLSFQYPTGENKFLTDVSLTIRPGEHIALVGENGAGKTTLIKLLCRLYDPVDGRITLDGIDLRELPIKDLRREISIIFQDYARYHLTARDNIWLGNTDLPIDDRRIVEAACQAGADGAINGLKNGYDTILGKWFEGGEELSVGEWQKVALARAFLRQAQIIVLDEPTSSMDARAEFEVFQKFHELAKGRTAILISHRMSTVRMADRIYVLERGTVLESGTHDELMDTRGKYASLFEIQSQYYK